MDSGETSFNDTRIRAYLALGPDYQPDPKTAPIEFLALHLTQLPPHLLLSFSNITTPRDRSKIPAIRNRRFKYTTADPPELQFSNARRTWPLLYDGQERRGQQEGEDERDWAAKDFLQGLTKHVNKLGTLLGGYEEEREAERFRALRRAKAEADFVPEEESDSEDDDDGAPEPANTETINEPEAKASFERLIRERFIYGLLEARRQTHNLGPLLTCSVPRTLNTIKWTGMTISMSMAIARLKSDGSTKKKNKFILFLRPSRFLIAT
ncbi:hypothetical protein MSAN_01464200 [Mycena sanguinolenta]|uniref:Uncharacterized protein n=1 Tax=Mycena sanguinolenta TaxID=230812 RepID=A0A8H6YBT6_9AGAR|nr:hypothetical protein MSAN_01464200 [Mycena sanguinolenta]